MSKNFEHNAISGFFNATDVTEGTFGSEDLARKNAARQAELIRLVANQSEAAAYGNAETGDPSQQFEQKESVE